MTFMRPFILLLLALPVIIAFFEWVTKGHTLVMPFDHGGQGRGRKLRIVVCCFNMLPALLLAIGILLAAGPRRVAPPKEERVLTNTIFCLDVSGSMTATFGGSANRYDCAMDAIKAFTSYRKGDAFGLTFFGNEVLHWVPVTKDTSAINLSVPFMNPRAANLPYWFGGTSIGKALLACREKIVEIEDGDKMIILLSDGESSDLYGGRDTQVATMLREDGIVVYVISVGDDSINREVQTIADITGGKAFQAQDPEALKAVFAHIDGMRKARFKESAPLAIDYFGPIVITGLVLLFLQLVAWFGVRYSPW
jgi:Ca-activated chloride channel homolog